MEKNILSVREIEQKDIPLLADYWFEADPAYLTVMGIDVSKMPTREQFTGMLETQIISPYSEKKTYALIWEAGGKPIGHSNLNPVTYSDEAYMHLHIWKEETRKKGFGLDLVKMSLPYYFANFKLKKLYCQPNALNAAPNKLLEKSGFTFVKEHVTVPGAMTLEQSVKLWEITKRLYNE